LPEQAEVIIRRRDEAEKRFRAIVHGGIADGSIVPCDPKLAVFTLLGAVNWVPKWYRDGGEWEPTDVASSLVDMAVRGIAAEPSPRLRGPGNSNHANSLNEKETAK